ncbi:hypothetical protein GA0115255_127375 [Streptomyces sp. Ncost-T6T-2b]|nr:hypothetical protein GA0115255_127375 [Streptomyces sp. Ncost-T6T-2b]
MLSSSTSSYSFCATCRQPSVRRKASVSTCPEPNISESRPDVMCRRTSISQKRSWAWTKPWARKRSASESA